MMFSFLMMVAVAFATGGETVVRLRCPLCGEQASAASAPEAPAAGHAVALPTASGHKLEPTIAGDSKGVKASRPENPG